MNIHIQGKAGLESEVFSTGNIMEGRGVIVYGAGETTGEDVLLPLPW